MKNYLLCFLLLLVSSYNYAQSRFLDSTFGNDGKVVTDFGSEEVLNSIAFQHDGKIVAGGYYDLIKVISFDEIACMLARYKTNGELDSSFGKNGFAYFKPVFATLKVISIQADDKIVGAGYAYTTDQGPASIILLRCKKNGALDSSFGTNGIVYFGDLKTNFIGTSMAVQPDGKFVVAGFNNTINSWDSSFVLAARFNNNGTVDSGFGDNGSKKIAIGFQAYATGVVVNSTGEIIVSGYTTLKQNTNLTQPVLADFTSSGELNIQFGKNGVVTFNAGNNASFTTLALTHDEKIIAGGYIQVSDTYQDYNFLLMQYNSNGKKDSSFGMNGTINSDLGYSDQIASVVIQPDDKIVAGGRSFSNATGQSYFALSRFNSNGKIDKSFGKQGEIFTAFRGYDLLRQILLQPDGKIVAGGISSGIRTDYGDFALSRYITNEFIAKPPLAATPTK